MFRNLAHASCANPKGQRSTTVLCSIGAVALAATFVLDTSDMLLAVMGAFLYWFLQRQGSGAKGTNMCIRKLDPGCEDEKVMKGSGRGPMPPKPEKPKPFVPPKEDCRMPTAMPIVPVKLSGSDWDAQVQELLCQIRPTSSNNEMVDRLVHIVTRVVQPKFPNALIQGYMSCNPLSAKAFAVAVPEVDIVLDISPELLRRVTACSEGLNDKQVQKAAVRTCTEALTTATDLKFRRSAFQSDEPMVTFLAPLSMGIAGETFGVNFCVNASTPSRFAALIDECAKLEPRAKDLILLVRRWARDRGIAHAAKGSLPPYAWGLLTIYFLQVGVEENGPLLPPMVVKDGVLKRRKRVTPEANVCDKTTGALFKDFIKFYDSKFDWRTEVASPRLGSRRCDRPPRVTPFVEDPFDVSNVASCVNSVGFARLREELARAKSICANESTSLAELLEIWAPPEQEINKNAVWDEGAAAGNWRSAGGSRQMPSSDKAPLRQIKAVKTGLLTGDAEVSLRPCGGSFGRPSSRNSGF